MGGLNDDVPPPEAAKAVASFLDEHDLSHLLPAFAGLSVAEFGSMVLADKAANMAALKGLGLGALKDRQRTANALSKRRRQTLGYGMPSLVCLYGSGLTPEVGRHNLESVLRFAANGDAAWSQSGWAKMSRTNALVLDPFDKPPYDLMKLKDWDAYIDGARRRALRTRQRRDAHLFHRLADRRNHRCIRHRARRLFCSRPPLLLTARSIDRNHR
jgi:hypothetical protein